MYFAKSLLLLLFEIFFYCIHTSFPRSTTFPLSSRFLLRDIFQSSIIIQSCEMSQHCNLFAFTNCPIWLSPISSYSSVSILLSYPSSIFELCIQPTKSEMLVQISISFCNDTNMNCQWYRNRTLSNWWKLIRKFVSNRFIIPMRYFTITVYETSTIVYSNFKLRNAWPIPH